MPVSGRPEPKRKRSDAGEGVVNLKDAAIKAIKTITADKTQDWSAEDIRKEARRRGMIPGKVYDDANVKAETEWLTSNGRRSKINVGTEEDPLWIRDIGVYYVTIIDDRGKMVEQPCWREWHLLTPNQHKNALRALFKNAETVYKEALATFNYVNGLRVKLQIAPLLLTDFTKLSESE